MNVSQLQPPALSQVHRTSTEAVEQDASFLSFKLLNKRARVRLSPEALDLQPLPGKAHLFCVANSKGWFAAAIQAADKSTSLVLSPLSDLHVSFAVTSEEEIAFTPKRRLALPGATPNLLAFASHDSRLVIGCVQGPIAVFDTGRLFTEGAEDIPPLHSFPSTTSSAPKLILPNPDDMPDLVAVLREIDGNESSQLVEILDVRKMESVGGWRAGNTPQTTPTSLSWSPKGKQLAVGLGSGDIVTFSPTSTSTMKSVIPCPPSVASQSVVSTTWLSNPTFHVVMAPMGPVSTDIEQSHFIASVDSKAGFAGDIKLNTPYLPFPGLRPPSPFTVVLRNWDPVKQLLVVGDSASSDIGVIGALVVATDPSKESWCNLSLEETGTPCMPLDKDMNDTVLIGLELDLTSSEPYHHTTASGESVELPPQPIMYAYASDGTVIGWHVVNSSTSAYPGMVNTLPSGSADVQAISMATSTDSPMVSESTSSVPSAFDSVNPLAAADAASAPIPSQPAPPQQQTSAFGQSSFGPQPQSAFGQSSFSGQQTSPFGAQVQPKPADAVMPPAFGQPSLGQSSAFGTSPAFGQSSFGSGSSFGGSSFGGGSAFGQAIKPATGFSSQTQVSGGFGAFASNAPVGFGFGTPSQPPDSASLTSVAPAKSTETPPSNPPMTPVEESMNAEETAAPSFGGLSLGGSSESTGPTTEAGPKRGGIFGQASLTAPMASSNAGASEESSVSSFIKPASGFGAFSSFASQPSGTGDSGQPSTASAFGQATNDMKPSSAFGQSSFGRPALGQPAFGQSAFGQPAFGQSPFGQTGGRPPAFGQTSFGAPSSGPSSVSSTTGGAFGSFAQAGPTPFGSTPKGGDTINSASSSGGGGFGAFSQGGFTSFNSALVEGTKNKSAGQTTQEGSSQTPESKKSHTPASTPFAVQPQTPKPSTAVDVKPTFSVIASVDGSPNSPEIPSPKTDKSSPPASPLSAKPTPSDSFGGSRSLFKSSTPASTTGAFAALQTSPTGFMKPAEGFGAFGIKSQSSSPFFNPPKAAEQKPVSVFGSPSTPVGEPSAGATTPVFGSSSVLGAAVKASPFGSAFATPVTPPKTTATSSAFSAFSGASSGFGAFSGPRKSFADMLKSSGDESKDPSKPNAAAAAPSTPSTGEVSTPSTPNEKHNEEKADDESKASNLGTSVTGDSSQEANITSSPSPSPVDTTADREADEKTAKTSDDSPAAAEPSKEPMAASVLSLSSSFVEVTRPSDDEDKGAAFSEVQFNDVPDEESSEDEGLEDDSHSFVSESVSEDEEAEYSENDELSKENGSNDLSEEKPSASSLPTTPKTLRPPSSTPKDKPEKPDLTTPSPVPSQPSDLPSETATTTPPGSPDPPEPVSTTPETTPAQSAVSGSVVSPFGTGLGRPSTRPVKSSPLAMTVPVARSESTDGPDAEPTPAKPAIKLRPASPKPTFGSWTPVSKADKDDTHERLTAVPPKSSPFGGLPGFPTMQPMPSLVPAPSSASSSGPLNFDKPFSLPAIPPASQPLTNQTPLFSSPPSSNLFGSSAPTSTKSPLPPSPFATKPPAIVTPPVSSIFGVGAASLVPGGRPINQPGPQPMTTHLASPPLSEPKPEDGMQAICAQLVMTLSKELDELRMLASDARNKREELYKPSPSHKQKSDIRDPTKWRLGDIQNLGQIIKQLENDVKVVKEQRMGYAQALRDLERGVLKASTRKEEIVRFDKARTDDEFAKMLKARSLGPEHVEAQNQLRREIRVMRDRIQKLEAHQRECKKKLSQSKAGKPVFKAPSLDTVNRTFRNIDLAIEHQGISVTDLTSRTSRLDLSLLPHASARDKIYLDAKKPLHVTPDVAVTTAAALNAERSAQRLKRTLLAARTEPLLNTTAVAAPVPVSSYATPEKQGANTKQELVSPSLSTPTPSSVLWVPPPIPIGDASLSPSPSGGGRHRVTGTMKHLKPIPLRKSPNPPSVPSSPAPSFDWGPLPKITPTATLSADVRPKRI